MARASSDNTRLPLDKEGYDPAELAVLKFFQKEGARAGESRKIVALQVWLHEQGYGLDPEAVLEACKRLREKNWIEADKPGQIKLTQEGWREAHR